MVAKTLADELGPRGVRVNGLLPGRVGTERVRELDEATGDAEAAGRPRTIPLGRYGEPAEFGRAAAFLLSPAASFVYGAMLPVDGGMLGRSRLCSALSRFSRSICAFAASAWSRAFDLGRGFFWTRTRRSPRGPFRHSS